MFKRVAQPFVFAALLLALCATLALAAPVVDNTLPFFGGGERTPAQQDADKTFVEEMTKLAGSREAAAEDAMLRGWALLKKGDAITAMKRFNQAWLLTPNSPDVLWGYAAALTQQQKFDEALLLFERANQLKPRDPGLLADYGYACIWKGASGEQTPDQRNVHFSRALLLLQQAESLQPKNPMIYNNRAIVRFFQARYAEAWHEVARAEAIAPGSVDPKFQRDLSARMPRPKAK